MDVGSSDARSRREDPATNDQARIADRALVDSVLAGDRDAFRGLVEREAPAVLAVCRRILHDPADAEDVAQDAFLVAYRKLASFRGDGPLGGWLMRIAMREATARARTRRVMVRLDDGHTPMLEAAVGRTGGATLEPAAIAEAHERVASLQAAIGELPSHYRDAVTMRYVEGLSFEEIAQRTGRPAPTVRTHLHRALARLRDRVSTEVRS